jgi:hypothetical protein
MSSTDGPLSADGPPRTNQCFAMSVGPAPPDSSDTDYSYASVAKPACLSAPFCQVSCAADFIRGLLACEPVEGGFFWSLGSAYIRVHGRKGGACVFDIGIETEGDVAYSRCSTPLPVRAWSGLSYVDKPGQTASVLLDGLDACTTLMHCSAVAGGPNPCDESQAGAPICPALGSLC